MVKLEHRGLVSVPVGWRGLCTAERPARYVHIAPQDRSDGADDDEMGGDFAMDDGLEDVLFGDDSQSDNDLQLHAASWNTQMVEPAIATPKQHKCSAEKGCSALEFSALLTSLKQENELPKASEVLVVSLI